jgi:hypothetical protein
MSIRLNGSTSGYSEIDAPAVAGNNTLVLPTGNGTADQALVTNGSGALSWSDRGRMTLATAQNSTSDTNIDFTGIPSWVKRVTVMFNGVSTNGTSLVQVQIGSGSITNSGYGQSALSLATGPTITALSSTTGFTVNGGLATVIFSGHLMLTLVSGNTWIASGVTARTDLVSNNTSSGSVTLSGTLDRIRITTVNGTDTFDAGSINILMEG